MTESAFPNMNAALDPIEAARQNAIAPPESTEQLHIEVAALRGRIVNVLTDGNVMIGAAALACAQVGGGIIRDYVPEKDHNVAYVDMIRAIWQQIEPINGDDKGKRQLEMITLLTAGNTLDEQRKLALALMGGVILTAQTKEKRQYLLSKIFAEMRKAIDKWPARS